MERGRPAKSQSPELPNTTVRLRTNLNWLSEQQGLTPEGVASIARIGTTTVRAWFRAGPTGSSPTLSYLDRMAEVLGVPTAYLLMNPEEVQERVEAEGMRPLLDRRALTSLSSPGFDVSSPSRRANRDRFGKARSKKPAAKREGNARFTQPLDDLRISA